MNRWPLLTLILITALTALSLVFVFPVPGAERFSDSFRPWKLGLDLVGGTHLIYSVDMSEVGSAERETVMAGLRDVIERRVNLFGVSEPQIYTAVEGGEHRLIADLAGVSDVSEAIRQIGLTPLLQFMEIREEGAEADLEISPQGEFVPTELTGRFIRRAQISFDQTTGEPLVLLDFNSEGEKIFEELTERNVGMPLGVALDGEIISAPIVQQRITGGTAQITGLNRQEARVLVERFNAGALPAPITLINQQTVSATLGVDSLERAVTAGLVGTLAIIIFMILYYGSLGFFAGVVLIFYIILTLAVFKIIPVTMTLAGVAGFLLSIGMAIDANILIFERMKEELKRGLPRRAAMEEGFRRAWTSIRDSNVATIITALILYYFTSSFVKGFALTLFIGVLISMFSAITITRTILRVMIRDERGARGNSQPVTPAVNEN